MAKEILTEDELNKLTSGEDSPKIIIKESNKSKIRTSTIVLAIIVIILLGIIIYLFITYKQCEKYNNELLLYKANTPIPMSQTAEYTDLMRTIMSGAMWTGSQLDSLRSLLRKYISHPNLEILISINDYNRMALLLIFGGNKQLSDELLNSIKFGQAT